MTATATPSPILPPQVRVFVRDWLSSNNVLLKGEAKRVLVDTGHGRHAPLTLALVASRQGLDGAPLDLVVNTHCHSDHMGGNAAVARAYGCPVAVPVGEVAAIVEWDTKALLLDYAGQSAERFVVDEVIHPGSTHAWGGLEWRAIAAPGHDMGALVFYNPEYRLLISGDALWESGFGLVMPAEVDPAALPATRATLETLARLDVRAVIPGHGEPFTGVAQALERAFSRAAAFESDPRRPARHALKALLTFMLLERRRMPLAELPAYVERVPIFRDFNTRFFRLAPQAYAEMLLAELRKSGAVAIDGADIVPAPAAVAG